MPALPQRMVLLGEGHRPTGHRAARQARQDSEAIRAAVTREGKRVRGPRAGEVLRMS